MVGRTTWDHVWPQNGALFCGPWNHRRGFIFGEYDFEGAENNIFRQQLCPPPAGNFVSPLPPHAKPGAEGLRTNSREGRRKSAIDCGGCRMFPATGRYDIYGSVQLSPLSSLPTQRQKQRHPRRRPAPLPTPSNGDGDKQDTDYGSQRRSLLHFYVIIFTPA